MLSLSSAANGFSLSTTLIVLVAVGSLACLDLVSRTSHKQTRYIFGVVLGSLLAFGLVKVVDILFAMPASGSGFLLAMGVLLLIVAWRMLFGTWNSTTKATVLGTALFWVILRIIARESPPEQLAHLIAIAVALLPVLAWMAVFLPYHKERLSVVLCMFFAGVLSTIPLLFYDALVRKGVSLNFLLFRLEPQSFSASAHSFVGDVWPHLSQVGASALSVFVSFLVVGIIEEGSKMWMIKKVGSPHIASIDDMLQLSILVAIGFAFAENVVPTGYFVTFVKQYLLNPHSRDWMSFIGNVAGRSVLTSMVHIVSTGLIGYFLGLAVFASPRLREAREQGKSHAVLGYVHRILGMREDDMYKRQMMLTGLVLAVLLHATSNFLVTLPDVLPNNPHTVGDLVGAAPGSPLHLLSLLLIPTFSYVVGGFFLLSMLFTRKENMKEHGHVILTDMFVPEESAVVE